MGSIRTLWTRRTAITVTIFTVLATTLALSSSPASAQPSRVAGKLVPATGALFGAYVDPDARWIDTQSAEGEIETFESQIGRKLDIDMHFYSWTNTFPTDLDKWDVAHGRTPLITWEPWGTTLQGIANGQYDDMIKARADAVADLGKPVFLRWGHEMNGNWYPWDGSHNGNDPSRYVAAWRHIHNIFDSRGATNAVWVWAPNNDSVPGDSWNQPGKYYPGDAFVDWVGIDGYNWGSTRSWSTWRSFDSLVGGLYDDFAGSKPIMVAETGSAEQGGDKGAWFDAARATMKTQMPAIAAFVYFDVDKENDWRPNSSNGAFAAYKQMANDPYFVNGDTGGAGGGTGGGGGTSDFSLSGVSAAPDSLVDWTSVSFAVNSHAKVTIRVLDASGAVVRHRIYNQQFAAGAWGVKWHGKNDLYQRVAGGRYSVIVVATDDAGTRRRARTTVDVV